MSSPLDRRISARLTARHREGLGRHLPEISDRRGPRYLLAGRPVISFCSNDYLGLADLISGPADPVDPENPANPGAGRSRLICGDLPELRALEAELATHVGYEAAIVFPSGFQANLGLPSALVETSDQVYSDRLNHASMIDGLRLARASVTILDHREPPPPPLVARESTISWWFTESIFSMEGDRFDAAAARTHLDAGGALYLDEAHSFGLFPGGTTLAQASDLHPDLLMCTLSKAAGCAGAFVATSERLATWLRGQVRSFVFSTGISPLLAHQIRRQLAALRGPLGERRRSTLWANVATLAELLGVSPPGSPIFPLHVGDNLRAVSLAQALLERGWHLQAIRPPTVPPGTARLRLTVSALHTPSDLEALAADLHLLFAAADLDLKAAASSRERPLP